MKQAYYSTRVSQSHVNFWTEERYGFDLGVDQCGYEFCDPLHYWEGIRDDYVLHYVLSGTGSFRDKNAGHALTAGMGFLVTPGVWCRWEASRDDPWEYRWVAFSGEKAWQVMHLCGINESNPVFRYDADDFLPRRMRLIYEASKRPYVSDLVMEGHLNLLLSELIEKFPAPAISRGLVANLATVNTALRFIGARYKDDITVDDIAAAAGVERSYLYRLFMKYTCLSPSATLRNVRLEHACNLLKSGAPVATAAYDSGFRDVGYFSKVFKEEKGLMPGEYRAKNHPDDARQWTTGEE